MPLAVIGSLIAGRPSSSQKANAFVDGLDDQIRPIADAKAGRQPSKSRMPTFGRRHSCPVGEPDEPAAALEDTASNKPKRRAPLPSMLQTEEAANNEKPPQTLQSLLQEESGHTSFVRVLRQRAANIVTPKANRANRRLRPQQGDKFGESSDEDEPNSRSQSKEKPDDLLSVKSGESKMSATFSDPGPESPRLLKSTEDKPSPMDRRGSCPAIGKSALPFRRGSLPAIGSSGGLAVLAENQLRIVPDGEELVPAPPDTAMPHRTRPNPQRFLRGATGNLQGRARLGADVNALAPEPPQQGKYDDLPGGASKPNLRRRASWAVGETRVDLEVNATVAEPPPLVKSFMPVWRPDFLTMECFDQFETYVVNSEILLASSYELGKQKSLLGIDKLNAIMESGKSVRFFSNDTRYSQRSLTFKLRERGLRMKMPSEPKGVKETSRIDMLGESLEDAPPEIDAASLDFNVISVGRTVAAYIKAQGIRRPFVITSQPGLLEDLRAAGITNYLATIDDSGIAVQAYQKPVTERRVLELADDAVDTVLLGFDQDLSPLKVAMATAYVEAVIVKQGPYKTPMPLVTCCSSEMKRRFKAISMGAACRLVGAGFDPDTVGFDSRMPSQLFSMVFHHPPEYGGYGVNVSQALMMGKSYERDIAFAKWVGMKSVLVCSSVVARLELADHQHSWMRPDWLLDDIAEIADVIGSSEEMEQQ